MLVAQRAGRQRQRDRVYWASSLNVLDPPATNQPAKSERKCTTFSIRSAMSRRPVHESVLVWNCIAIQHVFRAGASMPGKLALNSHAAIHPCGHYL